jgi:hypothetical protein
LYMSCFPESNKSCNALLLTGIGNKSSGSSDKAYDIQPYRYRSVLNGLRETI